MLREFTDTSGILWQVWDITPTVRGRTSGAIRRSTLMGVPAGWLCFESEEERRRLAPIPDDWQSTDDLNLEYYCSRAERVAK